VILLITVRSVLDLNLSKVKVVAIRGAMALREIRVTGGPKVAAKIMTKTQVSQAIVVMDRKVVMVMALKTVIMVGRAAMVTREITDHHRRAVA
jgi:hypothetical protein